MADTQKITSPFVNSDAQTGGETTPAFATAATPKKILDNPTPLEQLSNDMAAKARAKFPGATPVDIMKGVGSVLFKPNPPVFKPKELSAIADEANTHQFYMTHPEFQGETISSAKPGQQTDMFGAIKKQQTDLFGPKPTGTLPIYAPGTGNEGITVPNTKGTQNIKMAVEFPEKLVNTAKDVMSLLTTGNLPTGATEPYNPQTGTGRRVPTFANEQLDMYKRATEKGFSPTAAQWISGIYGAASGILDVTIAGQMLDGMSKSVVTNWSKNIEAIDATTKLGNPATMEEADTAYKKLAHDLHPDRPGGDAAKMAEVNQAWDTIKENGGPVNPSKARYAVADMAYRLQGPASDALKAGFAGPEKAAYGNIAGLLPGYAPANPPQVSFGLSTQEVGPVGFGEELPKGYEISEDGAIVPSEEYKSWQSAIKRENKTALSNEKDPLKEPYSPEAQAIYDNANTHDEKTWKEFSIARGYTPKQIAQYEKFQNLFQQGKKDFGMTDDEVGQVLGYGEKVQTKIPPQTVDDAALIQSRPSSDIKSPVELPESGMKQINRLLATQPMSPINFGIGLTPDGTTVNLSDGVPGMLSRAGKRQVIAWSGTNNGKSALIDMTTAIINKSADFNTQFDKSVMGAYQDMLSNLDKTKAIEMMIQVNDPRLNFVPPGEKSSLKEIYQAAIEALKNDPGGEVLRDTAATTPSKVQTIPSDVAKVIYETLLNNTTITGGDILTSQDIEGYKAESEQLSQEKTATQSLGIEPTELVGEKTEAGKGATYGVPKGAQIKLTPQQQSQIDELRKAKTTDDNGKEIPMFSETELKEFAYQMTGKPLQKTTVDLRGGSSGFHAVGEEAGAEMQKIAAGEGQAPISVPRTPHDIAKQIVETNLTRAIAEKIGVMPDSIEKITKELISSGPVSAQGNKLTKIIKSYTSEGIGNLIDPLINALEKGDIEAISKFNARSDNSGITQEKFQEALQNFDAKPVKNEKALAQSLQETFGFPKAGNNPVAAANSFLESIGFPGNISTMFTQVNDGITSAVKSEVIPHVNPGNGNSRPSKYYMGKQMIDNYFGFTGAEGKALGIIKNTLSDYLNRITYFPEPESRDLFGTGDTTEGIGAVEEPKKKIVPGGTSGITTRTQYGQGRVFEHPLDAIEAGAMPRVVNYETRMKDYGYKYARAYATKSMINAISSGKIGMWSPGRPADAQDWMDLGQINKTFEHHVIIKDTNGDPKIMRQSLWVPKSFGDKLRPIIDTYNKPKWFSNMRALQSYNKYVTLSLSPFHMKQLSIVAAAAAGTKNVGTWFSAKLSDPAFTQTELEFLYAGGMTSAIDKKMDNFIHLKFGEEAGGETIRNTKLKEFPVVGKVLGGLTNNPLTRLFDKMSSGVTDLTFDKMQRFYKVTAYSSQMADWMAKNPNATVGQISARQAEAASLVNGFFGGLNFESLGWGKGAQEVGRSLLLALDWTVSNAIPTWRAIAGRPKYLTEVSEPGAGKSGKVDAESLKFIMKSVLGGMLLTQMTNYVLNGEASEDWTNVTIGIDAKGRDIKANLFFAGDTRDIVNLLNYTNESGWAGVYQFLEGKAAPGVKTAIELATGQGKDPIGNNIWDPWDNGMEKLWKGSLYAAKGVVPVPIAINNPVGEYQKYFNKGGTTAAEDVISATNFGYISHKHMSQSLENNFWQAKTDITAKIQRKEPLTANEIAIGANITRNGAKIKSLEQQRTKVGESSDPYQAKYAQITALDDQVTELITQSLNPTSEDLMRAADKLQRTTERDALRAQIKGDVVNTAASPL